MVWLFALGLVELKFSRFQKVWSTFDWFLMLLPLASMLVGMFVVYVINYGQSLISISETRNIFTKYKFDSHRFYRMIVILFIAYIVSYIVSFLIIGYIPFFTATPDVVRSTWGVFGFGLFIQSIPALLFLMAIYFFLVKNKLSLKILLFLMFITASITYLLLLQRYQIIMPIIFSIVFIYYTTRNLKFRNVIILLVLLTLFMYGISSFRLSRYALHFLYYLSQMKFDIKYEIFTEPYMYVVMNLENFIYGVKNLTKFSYGVYSFDFIWALSGIKYPLQEYMNLVDYPHLISNSYNTYTMFFIYYRDFGITGLMFFPFATGFIFSWSYYKMRKNPNLNSIAIYSLIAFVIILSFFVPIITFLHFASDFFFVYMITKLSLTRKERHLGY